MTQKDDEMVLPDDVFKRCALVSKRWTDLVKSLEAKLYDRSVIERERRELVELLEEKSPGPKEYHDHMGEQYLLSQYLSDEALLHYAARDERNDEVARAILGEWEKRPAFFCAFTIVAKLDTDYYEIESIESGERLRLFSRGLHQLQEKRESRGATYITLLVDNGLCMQSAGIIHYNRLTVDDLRFIGHVIDDHLYSDEGIDGVLRLYPEIFAVLDRLSNIPNIPSFSEIQLIGCLSHIDSIDYEFEEPFWRRIETDGAVQYLFEEASDEMVARFGPQPFFDTPGPFNIRLFNIAGSWMLLTHAQEAFDVFSDMVGHPLLPVQYHPSVPLILFLEEDGYIMPWSPCMLFGDDEEEDEDIPTVGSAMMDSINAFMMEYVGALNEGKGVDVKRLAKRHGLEEDEAESMIAQLTQIMDRHLYHVPAEEEAYQIGGVWRVPSPAMMQNFSDSLSRSTVFFTLDTEEGRERFNANTQDSFAKRIEGMGVMELVETLFLEVFDFSDLGYTVLNLLLWIVLEKRDEPVMVRSIAVEAFKAVPYLSQTMDLDSFVPMLSEAIIKSFLATSLLRVAERPRGSARHRGLFTVQATPLLTYLVTPIPHSV